MSEPGYREIQLTGKQLVFLFMASVVLAVAIFLLGVSVGRGVRDGAQVSAEPAAATSASALEQPAEMPPATTLTPADLSYHSQLLSQREPEPAPGAAKAPEQTPPAPDASSTSQASPTPGSTAKAPPAAAASTPTSAQAAPAGEWYVQTGAYSTRANADRASAELKKKGHSAIVMRVTQGVPFRVRFGPFADRAEADRFRARLTAEGISSSVTQ